MQNKNKMNGKRLFIVAIALLLLVVFTLGGSTFAKYITTKVMPTKQATVAKWGHVITINAEGLFGTDYTKGQQGTYAEIVEADTGVAVNASATSNVVAPGTTGSMTFTIAGTAEVLSKLNVTATGTDIELKANVTKNTEQAAAVTYSPVKWTLVFAPAAGGDNQTLVNAGTLTACVTAINALNGQVANANATFAGAGTYTLSWAWAFDNSAVTTAVTGLTGDDCDTILGWISDGAGNAAAKYIQHSTDTYSYENNGSVLTAQFGLTISIEQIQQAPVVND